MENISKELVDVVETEYSAIPAKGILNSRNWKIPRELLFKLLLCKDAPKKLYWYGREFVKTPGNDAKWGVLESWRKIKIKSYQFKRLEDEIPETISLEQTHQIWWDGHHFHMHAIENRELVFPFPELHNIRCKRDGFATFYCGDIKYWVDAEATRMMRVIGEMPAYCN